MSEPFIGQVVLFGGNFAPRGWALCDGQLLPINSHSALFSILGTTYGGDGRTTFGLPDLRGRVPMHAGRGPGLTPRNLGERGGAETVTLTQNQIPAHNHPLTASASPANDTNPTDKLLARSAEDAYVAGTPGTTMSAQSVSNTGGGQAHGNVQPFQCLNYIIALEGTYPSRN